MPSHLQYIYLSVFCSLNSLPILVSNHRNILDFLRTHSLILKGLNMSASQLRVDLGTFLRGCCGNIFAGVLCQYFCGGAVAIFSQQ